MRIGIDGRKLPGSRTRGPLAGLGFAKSLGMEGVFFRTVLDMSPTLDAGLLSEIEAEAGRLGLYLETGLGKVNPFASAETPELRAAGDGDVLLGLRRIMEAAAAIGCRELWCGTANRKPGYRGRLSYDRFRTDVSWEDQLAATARLLIRLKPIACDLGIHLNVETHEEITSFEVVRLVETVGPEAVGIVYDTSNGLHRMEVPEMTARRIAPYVRQTHLKDAHLGHVAGGLSLQNRACGDGIVDFAAVLQIIWRANPEANWTIENSEPHAERSVGRTRTLIEYADPAFLDGHPDLTVAEATAFLALVERFEQDFASRALPNYEDYEAQPYGLTDSLAEIARSHGLLRSIAATLS